MITCKKVVLNLLILFRNCEIQSMRKIKSELTTSHQQSDLFYFYFVIYFLLYYLCFILCLSPDFAEFQSMLFWDFYLIMKLLLLS